MAKVEAVIGRAREALPRARPKRSPLARVNPYLVVLAALAAGVGLAKLLDWLEHAYPRR